MKRFFRTIIAALLAACARGVVRRYRPKVVMVTGSVGKTSTKDAIAAVLRHRFYLRASEKSYNSEFGVPLTILGASNPWTSAPRWLHVFMEALALLVLPNHYPKVLVLEVGADRPGDLARILRIVTPDVVVVTRLPEMPVHVEAYATPAAVREEEFAPAYALSPGAPLIVSADDAFARALAAPLETSLTTYGVSQDADVRIREDRPCMEEGKVAGIEGTFSAGGEEFVVPVKGALGRPQLLAPAAGIAVGLAMGMSLEDAQKGAAAYEPPAGRGRLLSGMRGAQLLDDSYNASPTAVREALSSLQMIHEAQPGSRRIAALGDMLELGRYSKEAHARVGREAAGKCDLLIAVGTRSLAMAEAALEAGLDAAQVHTFASSEDAASFLKESVQEGDIVLIKGSQSMRMERIAEALLRSPDDRKFLVRQDPHWKRL